MINGELLIETIFYQQSNIAMATKHKPVSIDTKLQAFDSKTQISKECGVPCSTLSSQHGICGLRESF